MSEKFNQSKYINEYIKDKYDKIGFLLPKGSREKIKAHAAARGESVGAFLLRAAEEQIKRDSVEKKIEE